jgi:hypothetical protein
MGALEPRPDRRLLSILLLALVLRVLIPVTGLAVVGDTSFMETLDTPSYIRAAHGLLDSGFLGSRDPEKCLRTPGYPLFLVPGLLLGQLELVTTALQIAVSCWTVYLVYRLARLLVDQHRPALLCGLLYAIEPLSILFASKLNSETLFTGTVVLFLYLLVKYMKARRLRTLIEAALALSASIYVRPIGLFLPLIVGLGLLAWTLVTCAGRKAAGHVAIFVALSMGLTGLWQLRNRAVANYPGFSTVADVNMYFYLAASVRAVQEGIPYADMQRRLGFMNEEEYYALHPEQRRWSIGERFVWMGHEGRRIVLAHPLLYARIHLQGLVRLLFDPAAVDYLKTFGLYPSQGGFLGTIMDQGISRAIVTLYRRQPGVFWANLLLAPLQLFYLSFAGLALLAGRTRRDAAALMVVAVAAYFMVVAAGPPADARFRHPAMPVICVFTGLGLVMAQDRWARRRELIANGGRS